MVGGVRTQPVIEVAFKNGSWWEIPHELGMKIMMARDRGAIKIGYTWDWGPKGWHGREFVINGVKTKISRYELDFSQPEWVQRNLDTNRQRSFRLVWRMETNEEPRWTGEIVHPEKNYVDLTLLNAGMPFETFNWKSEEY